MEFIADRRTPIIDVDFEPSETWVKKEPSKGDHIRVQRVGGIYSHHGVYVSDDEVIHFTGTEDDSILDWSKPEVIKTDLSHFLKDGILEVREYTDEEFSDLYTPEQIVDFARACLGEKGYNLFFNNCEHFANMCTLGRFRSKQVENVILGKLPIDKNNKGEGKMGLFSKVGNAIKGLFGRGSSSSGSRTTSSTTYEPDKVKIAEIEADARIRAAHLENDRVELMKQAQLETLQFETEMKIAVEQAKAQGFNVMAKTIVEMRSKMNEIAEKRLEIIEKGSLGIIKEIEAFYDELGDKIEDDNNRYNTEQLPKLLSILENYEEGTSQHKLYSKKIDMDMEAQMKHYLSQINNIAERQNLIISNLLESKNRIIDQTNINAYELMQTNLKDRIMIETSSSTYNMDNNRMLSDSNRREVPLLEDK